MAAKNDVTNDEIKTKGYSKSYSDNFDKIFTENFGIVIDTVTGKEYNKCSKRCWMDVADGIKTCIKQGCNELEKE